MQAQTIKIQTPKKVILNGFIFGSKKAKIIYIFLHGLGGGLFSRIELIEKMAGDKIAVMVFNNRGQGLINRFKKINQRRAGGFDSAIFGSSYELFSDCIDDIKGAIRAALDNGYKKIILVGHSTGSNKVAYYLSKSFKDNVLGGILLAPMSDYAAIKKEVPAYKLRKAKKEAEKLVFQGKEQELLSPKSWTHLISAQRFLSLFTPESKEEIFSYASTNKSPILRRIKKPILIVLAGKDEYADREMTEIFSWFKREAPKDNSKVIMINNSLHNFSSYESKLKRKIFSWVSKIFSL
jgi:alpha-beta hydrolase superfamily lysophospholipase